LTCAANARTEPLSVMGEESGITCAGTGSC
jgi:hypothetical protein